MIFAGMALLTGRPEPPPRLLSVPDNSLAIFQGCVTDPALVGADRERFAMELAPGARAQVSLYAKPDELFPALPYGTIVELEGKARTPHNYANPGAFDYVHYLARQDIYWSISALRPEFSVLPGRCGNRFQASYSAIRSGALARLDRLYPHDIYTNGMMQAILLGATAKLDKMWTEDYRSTGTFHALVISGTHVAILAGVFLFLLRICAVPRGDRDHRHDPGGMALRRNHRRRVAGAALGHRDDPLWDRPLFLSRWKNPEHSGRGGDTVYRRRPRQVFDASFQLTFFAVALIGAFVVPALAATSGPLAQGLTGVIRYRPRHAIAPENRTVPRRIAAVDRDNAACYAEADFRNDPSRDARRCPRVPLSMGNLHDFAVHPDRAGAADDRVFSPPASFGSFGERAGGAGAERPAAARISHHRHQLPYTCRSLSAWLLEISRRVVSFHARWEPDWRIPAPPWWLGGAFVLLLVAAAWRKNNRVSRSLGWHWPRIALAAIAIHPFPPEVEQGSFELSTIDVGQGDSLLTAFPSGQLIADRCRRHCGIRTNAPRWYRCR